MSNVQFVCRWHEKYINNNIKKKAQRLVQKFYEPVIKFGLIGNL